MKFDLVGEAYRSRSVVANSQQTINYYPEVDKSGKNVIALYNTEGTVTRATLTAGTEVRGVIEYDGVSYWVSGNMMFSMNSAYVVTGLGTLATQTGPVFMATNGLVILLVDGSDGYTFTFSGSVFATIVDVDFPDNPVACDILDNNFIVIDGGTQTFYTSPDGTSWAAADFSSAEAAPDDLLAVIVDHQEIILGGEKSVETWYNSGDATFTFSRRATIEIGVAATGGMCKADNSVFFLGNDRVVWRLNGYTPVRVSQHGVEYALSQMDTVSDCKMWAQKREGHVFIWLQFPTADQTWVYDVATSMWHRRAYRDTATGALERHRANCYVLLNGVHLVGDHTNGKVYELDPDTYDDDGDEMPSIRVSGHVASPDFTWVRHNRLTIDMETGVGISSGQGSDPQILLEFSDDGGRTWSNELWRDIGEMGKTTIRCQWDRLGMARDRVYRTTITDPVKRVMLGASLDMKAGRV